MSDDDAREGARPPEHGLGLSQSMFVPLDLPLDFEAFHLGHQEAFHAIFARYVRTNGSRANAPSDRLESEVDRLAARTPGCSLIVVRPDRQLVDQLQRFTAGRR